MISWDQALEIIESRELDKLVRSKEQIASYREAKEQFKKSHGGTAQYVIAERLRWGHETGIVGSGAPVLTSWDDTKVLPNDFSYDFEPGIRHFVVWSKTTLPCGPDEFPTEETCARIEKFLDSFFVKQCGVPRENLAWFKNTVALQSIPTVSHFHVLVRHCTDAMAERIRAPQNGKVDA